MVRINSLQEYFNWHLVDMMYESAYTLQQLSEDGTEFKNTLANFLQIASL
jgi:hypothetical protein